jgi:hypothetical protein
MDSKSWVKERLRARQNPNYGYLNHAGTSVKPSLWTQFQLGLTIASYIVTSCLASGVILFPAILPTTTRNSVTCRIFSQYFPHSPFR